MANFVSHIDGKLIQPLRASIERVLTGWVKTHYHKPIVKDVTYTQLVALKESGSLIAGVVYRLTDYRTHHAISDHDGENGVLGYNTGPTEVLLLTAVSSTALDIEAKSELYPNDRFHYGLYATDYFYERYEFDRGCIFWRYDTLQDIQAWEDFRHIKYRRWETSLGSGIYTSLSPVGNARYQDFYMFNDYANTAECSINHHRNSSKENDISREARGCLSNTVCMSYTYKLFMPAGCERTTFVGYVEDTQFGTCSGGKFLGHVTHLTTAENVRIDASGDLDYINAELATEFYGLARNVKVLASAKVQGLYGDIKVPANTYNTVYGLETEYYLILEGNVTPSQVSYYDMFDYTLEDVTVSASEVEIEGGNFHAWQVFDGNYVTNWKSSNPSFNDVWLNYYSTTAHRSISRVYIERGWFFTGTLLVEIFRDGEGLIHSQEFIIADNGYQHYILSERVSAFNTVKLTFKNLTSYVNIKIIEFHDGEIGDDPKTPYILGTNNETVLYIDSANSTNDAGYVALSAEVRTDRSITVKPYGSYNYCYILMIPGIDWNGDKFTIVGADISGVAIAGAGKQMVLVGVPATDNAVAAWSHISPFAVYNANIEWGNQGDAKEGYETRYSLNAEEYGKIENDEYIIWANVLS